MSTGAPPSDRRSDEDQLRALSVEYAAAADGRDGERFAALFTDRGALVVPNYPDDLRPVITRSGGDTLRQVPELLRRYDRTFHQLSNHRYAVDGDDATGEVLCVAHHASTPEGGDPGNPTDTVWFIRYRDTYRRTRSGWRFARRELHLQWVEEHPVAGPGVVGSGDLGS
jgi:SnoaL-like domain